MTTAQQQITFIAGLTPADYSDEHGAAFMYDPATLTTWLPAKAARQHRAQLEAAGFTVEVVAAPHRDREYSNRRDFCPGF